MKSTPTEVIVVFTLCKRAEAEEFEASDPDADRSVLCSVSQFALQHLGFGLLCLFS